MYTSEEMLMLSGIQHYRYCPRQWALIHIGQEWSDNHLTAEGSQLHERVDDPSYRSRYGMDVMLRHFPIVSQELGLYGYADIIELTPDDGFSNPMILPSYPGNWQPLPVEYKHGKPKDETTDIVQVVAQAMCLEEMFDLTVRDGAIYYAAIRRRQRFEITDGLRTEVRTIAQKMHEIFDHAVIPKADFSNKCKNCSLNNLCMPELSRCGNASSYLKNNLYEETS